MSDNVFLLPSAQIPGQTIPEVIEKLEELLAQAKAGNIVGIAFVTVLANTGDPLGFAVGNGWKGAVGTKWALAAGVAALQHRIGRMLAA